MKKLTPAERLIVAADFNPEKAPWDQNPMEWVKSKVFDLCTDLSHSSKEIYIKVNSGLRAHGYEMIEMIHHCGLRVFADLKLDDIPQTLATDGALLRDFKPELLTVKCSAGTSGMEALRKALPKTEILGVTVLTSQTEVEVQELYGRGIDIMVERFALAAQRAGIGGLIASPKEAAMLRANPIFNDMTLNIPGIRPSWARVKGDDQKRVMTPAEAREAGADRIVVGRPIIESENPYEAMMRTIEEMG